MPTKITISNNGPVRIEGDFEIFDQAGNKYDLAGRAAISLCRCGNSAKKPFCDGSHRSCSFQSEVIAYKLDPPTKA